MSNPDVRVFVTLPSNPGTNDGIIDLMINAGTVPYYIKYFKQNNSGTYIIAHEVKSSNTGDEDFLNAGVGTYRIEIADAHCAFLSLDVVVSFDCNCPLPVLYYNDAGCYLHWNPECQNGYSYTLEKLSGITWAEIQTQNAQHPIQSNGSFRLKFSRPGCNTQYSDVVATACLMPPSCMCTPPYYSILRHHVLYHGPILHHAKVL
ncbi:MAG: hypothetical protein IPL08_14175 [Saprospiraceae bacterium]|nr:hypothetical protein [Saprospiraceae bacterium]